MWAAEMGRTGKRRKSCHSETGNFNYILDCSCKKKDGLGFSLLVASIDGEETRLFELGHQVPFRRAWPQTPARDLIHIVLLCR